MISVKNADKKKFHFSTKSIQKMSIFLSFLKLRFSSTSNHSFLSTISKTIFSYMVYVKKTKKKRVRFLDIIHGLTPFKKSIFWPLLKLQFFGLKMIVFYLKNPKKIYSDIISVKNRAKRKFDFWTKFMD